MLPIKAVHHLSFTVPDLAEARAFWCGLLGFTDIPRPDFPFAGSWLRGFGTEVHLLELPGQAAAGGLSAGRNHVAFRVDSLDAARGLLNDAGVEILEGGGDIRQMFVLGPGGAVIEFIEPSG